MPRRHWWSREPAAGEKPSADSEGGPSGPVPRDLGSAVGGALRVSLDVLAGVGRPKTLRHDASQVGDRARAALRRDRELRAASPQVTARGVAPSEPASSGHDTRESHECADNVARYPDEPIRTRTMARLYAQQGLEERALRIYEYLLEKTPDAELAREAAALAARLKSR